MLLVLIRAAWRCRNCWLRQSFLRPGKNRRKERFIIYSIIPNTKKVQVTDFHYLFQTYEEFYQIFEYVTLPLFGVYKVGIKCNRVDGYFSFQKIAHRFQAINISIIMDEEIISYIVAMRPDTRVGKEKSPYSILQELIQDRGILFDRYQISRLYSAIGHETGDMMAALDLLQAEYPKGTLINKERLDKLFIIEDIVYPRNVLIAFLKLDRRRYRMLSMCEKSIDGSIIIGATVKQIKKLVAEKAKYFMTGEGSQLIKTINTQNLMLLYKIFITDRGGLNDPFTLYKLYESGVSALEVQKGEKKYVSV